MDENLRQLQEECWPSPEARAIRQVEREEAERLERSRIFYQAGFSFFEPSFVYQPYVASYTDVTPKAPEIRTWGAIPLS